MVAGFTYDLRVRLWEMSTVLRPQAVLFGFFNGALFPFLGGTGLFNPIISTGETDAYHCFSAGCLVLRGGSASAGSLGCDVSLFSVGFRTWLAFPLIPALSYRQEGFGDSPYGLYESP
jgi:hypothetical protein